MLCICWCYIVVQQCIYTAQRTHAVSIINTNRYREAVGGHENARNTQVRCLIKMWTFSLFKRVVHIVTTQRRTVNLNGGVLWRTIGDEPLDTKNENNFLTSWVTELLVYVTSHTAVTGLIRCCVLFLLFAEGGGWYSYFPWRSRSADWGTEKARKYIFVLSTPRRTYRGSVSKAPLIFNVGAIGGG